jgi:hypothetical protein
MFRDRVVEYAALAILAVVVAIITFANMSSAMTAMRENTSGVGIRT